MLSDIVTLFMYVNRAFRLPFIFPTSEIELTWYGTSFNPTQEARFAGIFQSILSYLFLTIFAIFLGYYLKFWMNQEKK